MWESIGLERAVDRRVEAVGADRRRQACGLEIGPHPLSQPRDDERDLFAPQLLGRSASASIPVESTCETASASNTSQAVSVGAARIASRTRPLT